MACKKTTLMLFLALLMGCGGLSQYGTRQGARPVAETETLPGRADEVAIWVDRHDPGRSVIIGNDKDQMGGLYVYDLRGKFVHRSPYLNEPTGVSVRYDMSVGGKSVDVVGCGIRSTNEIRLFKIDPDTRKLEDITTEQGISTGFERDTYGFCLYKSMYNGKLYAFVSRKETDNLHQILLEEDGQGKIKGTLVRQFGKKNMKTFVEGMLADDEYGYLYASDEQHGILKFYAEPGVQLDSFILEFGLGDQFHGDREGIALYKKKGGEGYLVISSQGNSTFKIFDRAGRNAFIKTAVAHGAWKSDGCAATSESIPPYYPTGLFVAHDDKDNNYSLFDWYSFSRLK